MTQPVITISGQRVYPRGEAPDGAELVVRPDARNDAGHLLTPTEMSPSGWASGGNDETFEAGLPFFGALVAVIMFTIGMLLLFKRGK